LAVNSFKGALSEQEAYNFFVGSMDTEADQKDMATEQVHVTSIFGSLDDYSFKFMVNHMIISLKQPLSSVNSYAMCY
jgi:hypothetical protein